MNTKAIFQRGLFLFVLFFFKWKAVGEFSTKEQAEGEPAVASVPYCRPCRPTGTVPA